MNYISKKQILYVNSNNKTDGTHTNFSINLDIDTSQEFDKIVLLDAAIPKSNYTIASGYNTFVVEENSVQRTITIPVGNYNRKSFKVVLQNLLNTDPETGYSNYTVTYDNVSNEGDTGKYTFSVTTSNPQPIFIFDAPTNSFVGDVMGFDNNTSNTFIDGSLVSSNVISFRQKNKFFLASGICQNRNNNILQSIVITEKDFEYVYFSNPNPMEYAKDFVKEKNNSYHFWLLDENNQVIDLNGLNVTFTLMLFTENRISDLLKSYIKYKMLA